MDVTEEILQNHLIYGASDNTAPQGLSASRSLNYAAGPSITRPDNVNISLIPYALKYKGAVGLFGTENYFVKVKVNLDPTIVFKCYEEPFWECAIIYQKADTDLYYSEAILDIDKDLTVVNEYEPAKLNMGLSTRFDAFVSVNLNNLKTGNIYIDSHLDVRLYTAEREEHPYEQMFVRQNDYFYVGFHARNTRRLDYNVDVLVGDTYISEKDMTDEQRKLIARVRR